MSTEQQVTLESLSSGAALELFGDELKRVLENISDPNTEPKAAREITLKVSIKPDEHREVGAVVVSTATKLAPVKKINTVFFFGRRGGQMVATERNPKQMAFDDSNVVGMKKEA